MISLICAMDRQSLIGLNGSMPWHRPADLKNFSRLTRGNTVIMGRKTRDSIGGYLSDRHNLIITHQYEDYKMRGGYLVVYCSADKLINDLSYFPAECGDVYIIGGKQIYEIFARLVDRMYLTVINEFFPLNGGEATFFPWTSFAGTSWRCINEGKLGPDFYYVYDRERGKGDQHGSTKEKNLLGSTFGHNPKTRGTN